MNFFKGISILAVGVLLLSSCLKKDYEMPPDQSTFDPKLPVNASIVDVKALKPDPSGSTNGAVLIDTNFLISGIVTADDRSGNLYKQINIEDSTGGIAILIDAYSLYNDYPVGRKIYVNLKGLYIGHYNGLPQLGYKPDNTGSISNIPASLVNKFITKANYPNPVTPIEVDMKDIKDFKPELVNRLITIKDAEFEEAYLNSSYAAPAPSSGTDVGVQDCSGNKVILRTSGFSNFQSAIVASGRGRLTALYTVYRSKPQLIIRDTMDVQFTNARCDGSGGGNEKAIISIDSLRKMFKGTSLTLPTVKIAGVVISDAAYGNITTSSLMLQGGDRGIYVFGISGSYAPGDSLVIDVSGDVLEDYEGTLELKIQKGKQNNIKVEATKRVVVPKQLTVSQINSSYSGGYSIYESCLVKIVNCTASGAATYGGTTNSNRDLKDGTGTMKLFTRSTATFRNDPLPAGAKSYTGIVGRFNSTVQLLLRNPANDVQ